MDKLEKIIAAIIAALESVQKLKADLAKCQQELAARDTKVAELETTVADLETALAGSGFEPSGNI